MADSNGKESTTSGGGIGDMISQGIEQVQAAVSGLTGKTEDTKTGEPSNGTDASAQNSGKQSDIPDEPVAEFIRDKYKSNPGEWPEQKGS